MKSNESILKSENGSGTVEFAIFAPLILFLIISIAELAFLFTVNANMWDVTRDMTRRLALHQLQSDEVERALADYPRLAPGMEVDVWESDNMVSVTLSLPFDQASLIGGPVSAFPGGMSARIAMLREPVR